MNHQVVQYIQSVLLIHSIPVHQFVLLPLNHKFINLFIHVDSK